MEKLFIVTDDGKKYAAKWAGISSIDGSLQFAILNIEFQEACKAFSDKENTSKLIYEFDGKAAAEYEGYTALTGINKNPDGSITVTLRKEN